MKRRTNLTNEKYQITDFGLIHLIKMPKKFLLKINELEQS